MVIKGGRGGGRAGGREAASGCGHGARDALLREGGREEQMAWKRGVVDEIAHMIINMT